MTRTPVNRSSAIRRIGHDPATNTLEVEFVSGGVHQYAPFTAEQHTDLVEAPSIGKYFHAHVRSNKDVVHTKLDGNENGQRW